MGACGTPHGPMGAAWKQAVREAPGPLEGDIWLWRGGPALGTWVWDWWCLHFRELLLGSCNFGALGVTAELCGAGSVCHAFLPES